MRILILVLFVFSTGVAEAQFKKSKKSKTKSETNVVDTVPKPAPVNKYNEIVRGASMSMSGLVTVHKHKDKYYFEIPDSMFGRDLLLVTRISKSPMTSQSGSQSQAHYAGDALSERVVAFKKGNAGNVFIQGISYRVRSGDSSDNGMYKSVVNSNLNSILTSLKIEAFNSDSSTLLVDMTNMVSEDNAIFSFPSVRKSMFKIGSLLSDRSYVSYIKAFPRNAEVRTIKTFSASDMGGDPLTFELNTSIILLPDVPMKPRLANAQIGYFTTGYTDFDINPHGVDYVSYITRWRLEPKDEDREKYLRGELVEPEKPIIFYIDPTTPAKWVPYLIQGVNDWQTAFEQAGFKNAIKGLEAPLNDSTWSLEDARHSAIVYKPSAIANASGPHVHDPRSGEILESHINWYHSVMGLIQRWYMLQAGAIDPQARTMKFKDELMGQLIRFVASHEVGHTLGLMHNFGSSSTVPVDSLRNKTWLEKHGHTPSIMDYARFNYVAQPEDSVGKAGIFPRVNDYDKWAIEWGYRLFAEKKTHEEEKTFLNKWIVDSVGKNPRLWYGPQSIFFSFDPRSQSEDLGDDAMKAGHYGIKNLKRIVAQLPGWTATSNDNYSDLTSMYKGLVQQYALYVGHVVTNIGGFYTEVRNPETPGNINTPVPAAKQRAAMQWLTREFFTTPEWLRAPHVTDRTYSSLEQPLINQAALPILTNILFSFRLNALIRDEQSFGKTAYSCNEFLNDLKKGLFGELKTYKPIDHYRRTLQSTFVDQLTKMVSPEENKKGQFENLELKIVLRPYLDSFRKEMNSAVSKMSDLTSRTHLQLLSAAIEKALSNTK